MEEEIGTNEGTAQPSDGQNEGSQGASPPAGKGAEARINELVAEREAFKAQAAANERMVQDLLQKVETISGRAAQPTAPQKDEDEVDFTKFGEQGPEFAKALKKTLQGALKQQADALTAQFGEQLSQLRTQSEVQQVRAMAAGLPEPIRQRAEEALIGSRRQGLPFTPDDTVKWAIGEAVLAGKYDPTKARRIENPGLGGLGGGSLGLPPPAPAQRTVALPVNFTDMSPAAQAQWAAKNGVDDVEI